MSNNQYICNVVLGMLVGIAAGVALAECSFSFAAIFFDVKTVANFMNLIGGPLMAGFTNVCCLGYTLRENIAGNILGIR